MIVIVDYGTGNLGSIQNMGRKAGGEMLISGDPDVIARAEKLILPGVGAFDVGMTNLRERGLEAPLNEAVLKRGVPILGICLGIQLFTRRSEEGKMAGLGWIAADTIRFRFDTEAKQSALKVPHMGWDNIEPTREDRLLKNLPPEPRFYFVHSYHLACDDASEVLTWTEYGHRFASSVQRGNIWGTQFHPEKSHKFGFALLQNFVNLI
ncbi:MAG: imidazole glycerol phosphate synthase subunit HisH [Prosthecobacter sp.]|uniref:imidazole glycerol phosphate synthase subunit HisH n=1 Tax=Prosthecobacter sp. TaxID=1965333 RepID=UPI0039043118